MDLLQVTNLFSEPLLGNFALEDISFTQQPMEKIAVIGETGSGKSTLLKTIAGLIQPKSGTILFNNKKVLGPDWQLIAGEKGIAYLSQHFELRNNYRMEELLQYANELTQEEANEIYKICRIDHLMKRNSYELSGGEKQRIALARLIISKPTLLILDEPYSNLDLIHRAILKGVIENICTRFSISCILTSHEPADIFPWAEKVLVIQQGKLVQTGTAQEVYHNPTNEYVAALLGSYTLLSPTLFQKFNAKNKICRIEDFKISNTTGVEGKLISLKYMGSYFIVTIKIEDEMISVKTDYCNYTLDSKIFVTYKS